jgi:hypothetical protein
LVIGLEVPDQVSGCEHENYDEQDLFEVHANGLLGVFDLRQ